jgi:hypothetical protein
VADAYAIGWPWALICCTESSVGDRGLCSVVNRALR